METKTVERFRREARALARLADDPEGFAQAVELHRELGDLLAGRAQELVTAGERPFSWSNIAAALGVTKSAAFQRFGRKRPEGQAQR